MCAPCHPKALGLAAGLTLVACQPHPAPHTPSGAHEARSTAWLAEPPRRFQRARDLAWAPGAGRLAVADEEGTSLLDDGFEEVRRWSVKCRRLAWTAPKALLCAALDGRVVSFDTELGYEHELTRFSGPARSVSAHGNAWVAVGDGRALAAAGNGASWELPVRDVSEAAYAPDGADIAVASSEGDVTIVSTANRAVRLRVEPPPGEPAASASFLRYSRDGRWLGATFEEGRARVLDARSGATRARVPVTGPFDFSPSADALITAGETFALTDAADSTQSISTHDALAVSLEQGGAATIEPDGSLLLRSWDARPAKTLRRPAPVLEGGWPLPFAALLEAARQEGRYTRRVPADEPTLVHECRGSQGALSVDRVYAVCVGDQVTLFDTVKGTQLWSVPVPASPVGWLEVSRGSGLVLVGTSHGGAVLLDLATGAARLRVVVTDHHGDAPSMVVSGYFLDFSGNIGFFGPAGAELAARSRCAAGTLRAPFAACRKDRLKPELLRELLTSQK